ncbi:pyridoxal phosphate-dependent aminotransferase [Endothiovibrio diazotrophicus]
MISPRIARRMEAIQPFYVMDLLARARALEAQGRSIIHMEVGEPDFVTPEPIVRAGIGALERGAVHYTPAVGLPALREAIAGHYRERFAIDLDPGRVVVTPGASGALQLTLGVLVNPGERVLMADPGYPCNRHFVRLFEGETRAVPVGPESGYQLTAELVERHWGDDGDGAAVAVLAASPANPTGTVIPADELAAIAEVCRRRGGTLIVDEIYHQLVYDREPFTALAAGDDLFVINSFSKYFGMTGWRLGWIVAPEGYVRAIDKLAQNIFLSAPTPAQHAALAAFTPECRAITEARRREFQARRDHLLPALRGLGFEIPLTPEGAFYLYADVGAFTDDSYAFAERLLEEAGVALTPGRDFGAHRPERHMRIAYTTSLENLREGVERIGDFLGR